MMLDGMVNGQPGGLGGWEQNSLVIHAVADRPEGPFAMKSVALPTQNTNPHLLYDPATQTYLLYTLSTGFGKCGAGMPARYGKTTLCEAHLHLKRSFLPRQARDKDRKCRETKGH
jgi:hypothetical protein